MNLSEAYKLARSRFKQKYNVFLGIFLTIALIILFSLLTIYFFYTKTVSNILYINKDFRRFIVYVNIENLEFLKDNEYIEAIYSSKYMGDYYVPNIKMFQKNNHDGTIYLEPIITDNDIMTNNGNKIKPNDTGKMICPQKLYPSTGSYLEQVDYFKLLNGEDYIGKKLMVDNINFEVIDTYDTDYYYKGKNVCYISFDDFKKLKSYESENGFSVIQIRKFEEVNTILKLLDEKDYHYFPQSVIDYEEINPIKNTTFLFLILLSSIIVFVLGIILNKKGNEIKRFSLLLKTLGYKNKDIIKVATIELFCIVIISLMLSFILFLVILFITKYFLLTEYLLLSSSFKIPFLLVIVSVIGIVLYLLTLNFVITYKNLKIS